MLPVLVVAGAVAAAAWLALLALPFRPWDLRPVAEDEQPPPEPGAWPPIAVVVPARNEAAVLPRTLPALLAQDYPGEWRAIVVDDRSGDGTAGIAAAAGNGRLTVVAGTPLPAGWVGKVWALEQATRAAGDTPEYLLLTDADIVHAPGSMRRLVAESEAGGLALNSRMARLRCRTAAERLLIPPFVFFFLVLYPMRLVNRPASRVAAAAGGCVLLRRDALERIGGFASIRGEVIDDVSLGARVKRLGVPIRLSLSRTDVQSVRDYERVDAVWRMVRRTAFDELGYSWLRLAGTLTGLALLFALPPALTVLGALGSPLLLGLGVAAWAASAIAFLPTTRYFGLRPLWSTTLPLAGLVYGAITFDSALRHLLRRRPDW